MNTDQASKISAAGNKMTKAQARAILIKYNNWRHYADGSDSSDPDPALVSQAIDIAVEILGAS